MPTQARGNLATTTGGTAALTAVGGFTPLNDVTIGVLVTAGSELTEFDMPINGRLRYLAALSVPFSVTSTLTVRGSDSSPADFSFRVAVNGATIGGSQQTRTLWDFLGNQGLSLQTLVTLAQNDYLEIYASTDTDANLVLSDLTIQAVADQPTQVITSTATAGQMRGEIRIDKHPSEVQLREVDFAPVLDAGETVSSGAVEIRDYSGADVTGMVSAVGSTASTVTYTLSAGTPGTLFFLEALATTSTGAVRGQRFRLEIPGP
jgi:hypothetical protein